MFQNDSDKPIFRSLKRHRFYAFLCLVSENLTLGLWRAFFWVLGFFGFWWLGLGALLPPVFQALFFLVFLAGFVFWIWRGRAHLRLPRREETDRFLEISSGLKHRPLSRLQDMLVNDLSGTSRFLWRKGYRRAVKSLRGLRRPAPRAMIAQRDLYGVRAVPVLLAVCGLVVAGSLWPDRLYDAFTSPAYFLGDDDAASVMIRFEPPGYTGMAAVVFDEGGTDGQPVDMPVGTVLKLSARSGLGQFRLWMDGDFHPVDHVGGGNHVLDIPLAAGEKTITLTQFFIPRVRIPVRVMEDMPPEISLQVSDKDDEPDRTHTILPEGTVRFPLRVRDDYGVKSLSMRMTLDPLVEDAPLGHPVEDVRSVMSPGGQDFDFDPVYDFTSSPWAGLPVLVEFTAYDHPEQTAFLTPISVVLPERHFQHPVAQTLVDLRKQLAWAPTASPRAIVDTLENLLSAPSAFHDDPVTFLAIRSAASHLWHASRLIEGVTEEDAWDVMALLWDTALRVEDGNLSLAARNLREAQRALEEALRDGTFSQDEIMELTDKVRAYFQEYMAELQRELQKRMADGQQPMMIPPDLLGQALNADKMEQFMQQLQSELMEGNMDKARDMLSQLQRMLDALNPSTVRPMPMEMQMMQAGRDELQELIDRQEELLEQTKMQAAVLEQQALHARRYGEIFKFNSELFEKWGLSEEDLPPSLREMHDLQNAEINTSDHKVEQEALRFVLGQLMVDAGSFFEEIPENLGLAELEMRASAGALEQNRPDLSVPHQQQAVAELKKAHESMTQQMMEKLQQMVGAGGMAFFSLPQMSTGQQDPLGRPSDPEADDDAVRFREHVQEILKQLQERSGELERPREELDYFRRLLRQF